MANAPLTEPVPVSHGTFLFSEPCHDLDTLEADIVFMGIPYGHAYTVPALANDQSNGPDTIRRVSDRVARTLQRYDFDLGGPIYDNRPIRAVDVGNVPYDLTAPRGGHFARAEAAMRKILRAGAIPVTFGGDHGIPIPVMRALSELGPELGDQPITLVQIDAHIDWREEVNGVSDGLSSVIRRASELPHIGQIFQIGMRSSGSAHAGDVEAALAYGANIITSYEVHDHGMQAVLDRIPEGGRFYLTIDMDGFDPSEAPGVEGPAPGGLYFHQVRKLIHGLVKKGRVVGMDVVEITPKRDVNNITSVLAGRLVANFIGAAVRADYFGK